MIEMFVSDEDHMLGLGMRLASLCQDIHVIFLYGNLGAGKTTLVRGFLRGMNYIDKVKSPTYTLVETYNVHGRSLYHFDFYRLHDPVELEFIGIQDYFFKESLCLVEWPDNAKFWIYVLS